MIRGLLVSGSLIGTVAVVGLSELMRTVETGIAVPRTALTLQAPAGLGDVMVALAMLLIIVYRPGGLSNGKELSWRWPGLNRRTA